MPFDPNAPFEVLEPQAKEIAGFDPTQPFEVIETPAGFDPSQPFEVDASTVGNPKAVADGIADALSTALNLTSGIPKPLTNILLRSGGKKTDIALNTLLPMAGGAVGTVAAPGVGTVAGSAAGGFAGESITELRQILRGERENFSPGSLIGTTAVSAIIPRPVQAGATALRTAGKTLVQRGMEGAFLGGAQEAVREVIDDGKLSLNDINEHALWGSAFGIAFGGLESAAPAIFKAIRGKPPKEAVPVLREEGTPPALAVADEIDAKLASGEVELPPPPAPEPGPEMTRLAETPAGATKLAEIQTALQSPDTIIQYSVWPADMIPPGRDRVAQVDLIDPKKESLGGLASTNRELLQELGIDAPPAPDSLPPGRYTIDEIKAAIAKETPVATTPEVGLGAASPKEFQPVNKSITGIKNEMVDAERVARGAPPLMSEARKDFGKTWDDAMKVIDEDQNSADRLLDEFRTKPKALTDVETAVLLHREIDLRNQFDRASKNIEENIGTPDSLASDRQTQSRVLDELNELEAIARQAGTETGRGLNARKLMAAEDYSLAKMLTKRRAAKGGAKLTPEEEAQVKKQHDEIAEAQHAFDQHEAQAELDAAITTPEAATEQITKLESELAQAPADKKLDDFKKRTRKRIDDLKKRVQSGDFSRKPKNKVELDEEGSVLQARLEKAKSDFLDAMERDRFDRLTGFQKLREQSVATYDAARNLMTTGEFSFVLRQGKLAAASHPIMTAKALPKAFQALFGDEVTARAIDIQTKNDPMAATAIENGVHFAEDGAKLSAREETLASRLSDKIPLLRNFNQAGRVFLNKLRIDLYKTMASDRQLTPEQGAALAKYVNEATGRGSLGGLEKASVELGRVLFAPRYLASRIQYATGHSMWGGDVTTRRIIAKEYAKTLVGLGVYYASLTAAFDALTDDPKDKPVVSMDPRSTDFGKVKIGNTRIDPLAGLSQVIVFGARTATGEKLTITGNLNKLRGDVPYGGEKWTDVAATFARSKLHPLPGTVVNLFNGTDLAGNPATLSNQAANFVTPLSYMDIYEALEEQDLPPGVAASLLAMLGEGLQTYTPRDQKQMGVARPEEDAKKESNARPAK